MAGACARLTWAQCQPCLFFRFVWAMPHPRPKCMCTNGNVMWRTTNMRLISNDQKLVNIVERKVPKLKRRLRTLAVAVGSGTAAYVVYRRYQLKHNNALAKKWEKRLVAMTPLSISSAVVHNHQGERRRKTELIV